MRRTVVCGLILAAIVGCETREPNPAATPPVPVEVAEASWDEQVAAVREGRSDEIRVSRAVVTAAELRQLADGCEGLRTLTLDQFDSAGGDLAALRSTPRLRRLKLDGPVDDAGVEAIAACRELEILNLPGGVFTDAGLERIAGLDRLTLLRFGSRNVTDAGIASLSTLPWLRFLHLIDVPVTDAGLDSIAGIGTLESFYLDGGNATDAGLRRLLEARPKLHMHVDSRHLPDDPNADRH